MNIHISQQSTSVDILKNEFNSHPYPFSKPNFHLIIQGQEYPIGNNIKIIKRIKHILSKSRVIYISNDQEVFKIPSPITKESFEHFINFMTKEQRFPDYTCLASTINICLTLELHETLSEIIENKVIPFIARENCIEIWNSITMNTNDNIAIKNVINLCSDTIMNNLLYIIKHKKQQLIKLPSEDIENIIEMYAKYKYPYNKEEMNELINFLYEIRNITSHDFICLLDNELRRILFGKNEELLNKSNNDNDIKIKININTSNSAPLIQNHEVKNIERDDLDLTIISNYNKKEDILILALQINNYEKEMMNTSIELQSKNNNSYSFLTNKDLDKSEFRTSEFFGFLSFVEINSQNKSPLNFQCLNKNRKNKILLYKKQKFSQLSQTHSNIEIKIHLERIYTYPLYLSFFCENEFEHIDQISLFSLKKLPQKILYLILTYDSYPKNIEQYKLKLLINWVYKNNFQTKVDSYSDLFELINFDELSMETLINFLMYCNDILLSSKRIMNIIYKELACRLQINNLSHVSKVAFSKEEEFNIDEYNNNNITESVLLSSSVNLTETFKPLKEEASTKGQTPSHSTYDYLSKFIFSIVSNCSKCKLNMFDNPNTLILNTEPFQSIPFKINKTYENNNVHNINKNLKKIQNRNLSSPILTNNYYDKSKHNKSNSMLLNDTKENSYNFPCKIPNYKKLPNSKKTFNNHSNIYSHTNNKSSYQNGSNIYFSNPSSMSQNNSTLINKPILKNVQKQSVVNTESKINLPQNRSNTPIPNLEYKKPTTNRSKPQNNLKQSKNSSVDYKTCSLHSMRCEKRKMNSNYTIPHGKIQYSSPTNGNNCNYGAKGAISLIRFQGKGEIGNYGKIAGVSVIVKNNKIIKCNSTISLNHNQSETPQLKGKNAVNFE